MKCLQVVLFILLFEGIACCQVVNLGEQYIQEWKDFYPSKALKQGMHASIFEYENLSRTAIKEWVAFNRRMQAQLKNAISPYVLQQPIDARLLRNQVAQELEKWELEQVQYHSLPLYTDLINKALKEVTTADFLTQKDREVLVFQRLLAMQELCLVAQHNLKSISKKELERETPKLQATIAFLQQTPNGIQSACKKCKEQSNSVADKIELLIEYLRKLPTEDDTALLGTSNYNRKLALYTDSQVNSKALSELALTEIQTVKKIIGEVSIAYFKKMYPTQTLPADTAKVIAIAFDDMEKDAPKNGADYLAFWQELSEAAIQFIEEEQIATLPKFQTLQILPAPESAGPAARIGWVASAPPFAPNPLTTLYLPSIPDTLPQQEQIDFWSSFNKPFNRMIVIHELFPGHYMQIKISRATPHRVRLLFPYAPYFEGYATFAERVCLDKGWEKNNPLTFLAHLRKRLENANRAYTSVQVHCKDWTQEQVMDFSTKTSLLAPQFAKSLWGRIMRSPMQLTSYFWGGQQFAKLLEREQVRLGDQFILKDFMDTILKAGAIPIDEFDTLMMVKK